MGDFDIDVKDKRNPRFCEFCNTSSMSDLVKGYTCFSKTQKSSTDLILTSKERSFQLTTMADRFKRCSFLNINFKVQITRLPPQKVMYRDFKNFNEKAFLEDVKLKISSNESDDSNQYYERLS